MSLGCPSVNRPHYFFDFPEEEQRSGCHCLQPFKHCILRGFSFPQVLVKWDDDLCLFRFQTPFAYALGKDAGFYQEMFIAGMNFRGVGESIDRLETNPELPNAGQVFQLSAFPKATDSQNVVPVERLPKV